MSQNYEKALLEMTSGDPRRVERLEFPSELVFVVSPSS